MTQFEKFLNNGLTAEIIEFIDQKYNKSTEVEQITRLMDSVFYDYNVFEQINQKTTHWDANITLNIKKKKNKKKKNKM